MTNTPDDDLAAIASGEFLEALRFVRAVFDDPLEPVAFVWTDGTPKALGVFALEVLKANAVLSMTLAAEADGCVAEISEDTVSAYVSRYIDDLITRQMARNAEDV